MNALKRTIAMAVMALPLLLPAQPTSGAPPFRPDPAAPGSAGPWQFPRQSQDILDERCATTLWAGGGGDVTPGGGEDVARPDQVAQVLRGRHGHEAYGQLHAVPGEAQPLPPYAVLSADEGQWRLAASKATHVTLRAGQHLAMRLDAAGRSILALAPEDGLTSAARWAIDYAPDWLADDLAAAFADLSPQRQTVYANLLLDSRDPIVDEVAFQIASLGSGSLTHSLFTPELIVRNAQLMYEHDRELAYVDIVDHGSAAEGGNYYSTTRYVYQSGPSGPISWAEIPRDIYYWYIVHPRLSDETVKASNEVSSRQATYGYFWREYLYRNPDPSHDYTAPRGGYSGFPLLADVLRRPSVLWDGQTVNLDGERPWTDQDTALDVLGHWVSSILPDKARGNRPIQPNQIAYEHDGNCGEIQDLLGAASRTGLVPNVLISDHCEDHVWNEVYVANPQEGWIAYQVDWDGGPTRINVWSVAYDRDQGGGKDVSAVWAWRPDGLPIDVVDHYSQACTLEVRVEDAQGQPVDGAMVVVYSEAWQSTEFIPATFRVTDASGTARFRLGDRQNYAIRVQSRLGDYPAEGARIVQVVSDAEPDRTYVYNVALGRQARLPDYQLVTLPTGDAFRLLAQFSVPAEFASGSSLFAPDGIFRARYQSGRLTAFLLSESGYDAYRRGERFEAEAASQDTSDGVIELELPSGADTRYVVLSADGRQANSQILDVAVSLYEPAPPATASPTASPTAAPSQTPGRPEFAVYLPCTARDQPAR